MTPTESLLHNADSPRHAPDAIPTRGAGAGANADAKERASGRHPLLAERRDLAAAWAPVQREAERSGQPPPRRRTGLRTRPCRWHPWFLHRCGRDRRRCSSRGHGDEPRAVTDACLDASGAMHACNLAHVLHSVCLCDALQPKFSLGYEPARTLGWTHGQLGGAERRTQLSETYILTQWLSDPLRPSHPKLSGDGRL